MEKFILHGDGLFLPMSELDRYKMLWDRKYECIAHYNFAKLERPLYIKDRSSCCRFCGGDKPKKYFKKTAHALSELIGNKILILKNECDECNEFFGKNLEDDFAKFLDPGRTFFRIVGKNGIPTFKDMKGTIRADQSKHGLVVQTVENNDNVSVCDKQVNFNLHKNTYTPIGAYKALVLMGISIMPEDELKNFQSTIDWIMEKSHTESKYDMSEYASHVICHFFLKPRAIRACLVRRKEGVHDVPYCQFVLLFNNYYFQIMIPCREKDGVYNGDNSNRLVSPAIYEEAFSKNLKFEELDLSEKNKVKNEKFKIPMAFKVIKELTSLEGCPVEEIMKVLDVKPLKKSRER